MYAFEFSIFQIEYCCRSPTQSPIRRNIVAGPLHNPRYGGILLPAPYTIPDTAEFLVKKVVQSWAEFLVFEIFFQQVLNRIPPSFCCCVNC